ncbi:MAG TPA: mandelate racemase/muconate lactonizing enzyme family protein [Dehalococcoidia bacterium]|nr:mandelate racemase/muconate lactonizing enzyme family protein [Dehalococcoidia bacterium]
MKITEIECVPISLPLKGQPGRLNDLLMIKIHTDEGITGIGDGGLVNQDIVTMMVKSWAPVLIGADPLDTGKIMSRLSGAIHAIWGMSYPAAVASVDYALWDLKGKALNQPVYQLLGGKQVEKLRFNYFLSGGDTADRVKRAEEAVAGGVKSLGLKATGFGGGGISTETDLANVKAVREAVGYDVELSIDYNASLDYWTALRFGQQVEEYDLFKYEQPVAWYDIDGLANLRKKLNIPICSHESTVLVTGLVDVIKKDAVDILGTKLSSAGGLTAGVQWAKIAKTTNLGMYCGGMNGLWEAAAQAHWLCSEAEFGLQSQASFFPVSLYGTFDTTQPTDIDIVNNPMKYKDGYFWPPEGPGLGLELNEQALPKYITQGKSTITIGEKERAEGRFFG